MKKFAWSYSRLKAFEVCPKKYFHTMVAKDFVEPEDENLRYGNKVHKALELRVAKGKKLPIDLSHLEPVAAKFAAAPGEKLVEQKLAITKDFQPTGWFDPDVWFRAIIDLAIVNPPKAVVVDYKTGKMSNDFIQLNLATAVFFLHEPEADEAKVMFYWTKHKKPTSSTLHREDIPTVWNEALPRVKKLEAAHAKTDFPARPSGLCRRYCPVKTCPYFGVGG